MIQIVAFFCNVFYLQSVDSSILNRVDQGNTKVVPENLSLHGTSASAFVGNGLPFLTLSPFSLFYHVLLRHKSISGGSHWP